MKLKTILNYRNFWMGIAMMAIVWYHFKINLPIGPLRHLKNIGFGGVDICLFASGIGCYYSLSNDGDVARFFKKRFLRLMPEYWVFIIFWIIFRLICDPIPLWAALGNFLGLQHLLFGKLHFNWYISGIIIIYLLTPLLFKLVNLGKNAVTQISILVGVFIATLILLGSETYMIIASRLPVFYVGLIFGRYCREDREIKFLHIVLLVIATVLGLGISLVVAVRFESLIWEYGLAWYPFLLVSPGACMLMSLAAREMERFAVGRLVVRTISKLGDYSFEIYLIHLGIFDVLMYAISSNGLYAGNLTWVLALLVTAVLCVILRRAAIPVEMLLSRMLKMK